MISRVSYHLEAELILLVQAVRLPKHHGIAIGYLQMDRAVYPVDLQGTEPCGGDRAAAHLVLCAVLIMKVPAPKGETTDRQAGQELQAPEQDAEKNQSGKRPQDDAYNNAVFILFHGSLLNPSNQNRLSRYFEWPPRGGR